jgi:predicted heme/steroid binding protein
MNAGCFYHPCFVARWGGVSDGKDTQGWRDSSHTAMVGAGKDGSAKLPMATVTTPEKPSFSQ